MAQGTSTDPVPKTGKISTTIMTNVIATAYLTPISIKPMKAIRKVSPLRMNCARMKPKTALRRLSSTSSTLLRDFSSKNDKKEFLIVVMLKLNKYSATKKTREKMSSPGKDRKKSNVNPDSRAASP